MWLDQWKYMIYTSFNISPQLQSFVRSDVLKLVIASTWLKTSHRLVQKWICEYDLTQCYLEHFLSLHQAINIVFFVQAITYPRKWMLWIIYQIHPNLLRDINITYEAFVHKTFFRIQHTTWQATKIHKASRMPMFLDGHTLLLEV